MCRLNFPVFQCVRPNAKALSVSQGKGINENFAKVSAIMESIETYMAENIKLPKMSTFPNLSKEQEKVSFGGYCKSK